MPFWEKGVEQDTVETESRGGVGLGRRDMLRDDESDMLGMLSAARGTFLQHTKCDIIRLWQEQ